MPESLNLPATWQTPRLDQCLELNQSGVWGDEPRGDQSDLPVLRSTNIQDSRLLLDDIAYRSISSDLVKKYALANGDLLITKSSGSPDLIGKNAIFLQPKEEEIFLFSNFTQRLRTNGNFLLPHYLFFYLNSVYAHSFLVRMQSTTSGLRNLNMSLYVAQQIPLPPLPEQQRIVAILRQSDELRLKRRAANQKASTLPSALFNEMFKGPSEWHNTIPLEQLVDFVGGGTPSRKVERYFTGDTPWATSKDMKLRYLDDAQEHITEEAIQNSATNLVPAGTILIVVKSKILAHSLPMGIITRPFCFGQDLKGMICKPGVSPQFIVAALKAQIDYVLNRARGVNTEGLTLEILRSVPMPQVDPDRQQQFTDQVLVYDQIEKKIQVSATKFDALFDSLLTEAFEGTLTASWRDAHRKELEESAEEMRQQLEEKKRPVEPVRVEITTDEALKESLSNFNLVAEALAKSTQEAFAKTITPPISQEFYRLGEILKPYTQSLAESLNAAMAQHIAEIRSPVADILANAMTPLMESLRQQSQFYYSDLLAKIARLAQLQQRESPTRAELQEAIKQVIEQLPQYWTLIDLAEDWRVNHLPRNTVREIVDMLVVMGQLRETMIRHETEDRQQPVQFIKAYTRVLDSERVTAAEIQL